MTYKKHLFLIIYNKNFFILVIKKNQYSRWELPSVIISPNKSMKDIVDEYISNKLKLTQYNFQGSSSIINKYELPKEFSSIAGFSGEEQKFEYISTKTNIDLSNKIIETKWIPYSELKELIKLKNFDKFKDALTNEFKAIIKKNSVNSKNQLTNLKNNNNNILRDLNIEKLD